MVTEIEDAFVDDKTPATNNGESETLQVGSARRTFLRATDLAEIPPDASVEAATLFLTCRASEGSVAVRRVEEDWNEAAITAMNEPSAVDSGSAIVAEAGLLPIDVTTLVASWVRGEPNYGLSLVSESAGLADCYSTEHRVESERPRFVIAYRSADDGSGSGASGNSDGSGTEDGSDGGTGGGVNMNCGSLSAEEDEVCYLPPYSLEGVDAVTAVLVADLDDDGHLDVYIHDEVDSMSAFFVGDGAGGFTAATRPSFCAADGTSAFRTGHFDDDGLVDILTSNGASLCISIGGGAGQQYNIGLPVPNLVVADIDGDGSLDDIVAADTGAATIRVYRGVGGGSIDESYASASVAPPADAIATGDLDGDGLHDVVALSKQAGEFSILLGQGDATLVLGDKHGPGAASDVGIGDVDGDGDVDVVVVSTAAVQVFPGNGDGTLGSSYTASGGGAVVFVGRFNGGEALDVAVDGAIYIGSPLGLRDQRVPLSQLSGLARERSGFGDLNEDGVDDFIVNGSAVLSNP